MIPDWLAGLEQTIILNDEVPRKQACKIPICLSAAKSAKFSRTGSAYFFRAVKIPGRPSCPGGGLPYLAWRVGESCHKSAAAPGGTDHRVTTEWPPPPRVNLAVQKLVFSAVRERAGGSGTPWGNSLEFWGIIWEFLVGKILLKIYNKINKKLWSIHDFF